MIVRPVAPKPCVDKQKRKGANRTTRPGRDHGSSGPTFPTPLDAMDGKLEGATGWGRVADLGSPFLESRQVTFGARSEPVREISLIQDVSASNGLRTSAFRVTR
jgi:hypothetical protein